MSALEEPRYLTRREDARRHPPAPFLEWETFWPLFAREYKQGQHVTIIGPTQSGKTTLAIEVLECRDYVLFLSTKVDDPVIEGLRGRGYRVSPTLDIRSRDGTIIDKRFVFWPVTDARGRPIDIEQLKAYQRVQIRRAIKYVWRSRRWTVCVDETTRTTAKGEEGLGLASLMNELWEQGSSAKIGVVALSQRPAWIPRMAYSSPDHLFMFRTNDQEDLDRLADIGGGINTLVLQEDLKHLKRHEFLYLAPREHPPTRIRSMVKEPRRGR